MTRASAAVTSFNGGELSPLMEGRTDIAKYPSGCSVLENFIPTVQGPVVSRGGTRYVDNALSVGGTYRSWLARFEFNYVQAFILEFSNDRLGFFTNRARLQVARTITGVANNGSGFSRVTSASHGFYSGQTAVIAGVTGSTSVNGTWVITVINANTFDVGATFTSAYVSGGTATANYTVQTPYTEAGMLNADGSWAISRLQTGDVVYLAGGGVAPQKLTRSANTSWAIASFAPDDGPFMDMNETSTTMTVSAITGAVTITASSSVFTASHVGALIRIERKDAQDIQPWETNEGASVNDVCISDGKTYKCTDAGSGSSTGGVQPTHTRGEAFDGMTSSANYKGWTYQDSGYGVARITGYTSGTQVSATVITDLQFPAILTSVGSKRWSFGAWGAHNEYPKFVTLWRDRLVWAGIRDVWMSKSGEYEKMAPDEFNEQLTDSGISVRIQSRDNNAIRWMQSGNALLVGTAAAEFVIEPATTSEPVGPANIKATPRSHFGGSSIPPVQVGSAIVFAEKDRRVVRELVYDPESAPYAVRNLTVLAEHVTQGGLVDLAYQRKGGAVLWAARGDGQLLGLTYEVEQEVYGWHRHPMDDAEVKAVQCIPSPDGLGDDVWLTVERTIDGGTYQFIERVTPEFATGDDPAGAVCLDCSLERDGAVSQTLGVPAGATTRGNTGVSFLAGGSVFVVGDVGRSIFHRYQDDDGVWRTAKALITGYTSGTTVTATISAAFPAAGTLASGDWALTATTITGLDHLDGATVGILADGSVLPDAVVSGGSITLTRASNRVQVGLRYTPKLRPMRLDAGSRDGTAQGKTKKVSQAVVRLLNTGGGEYGADFDSMDPFQYRTTADLMDEAVPLYTGDKEVPWPGTFEKDGYICLQQHQPLPMTVVAIFPRVTTSDR